MVSLFAVSGLAFLATEQVNAQTITVYIGAPDAQTTTHGVVLTETFDSWSLADPQTGTVTSTSLSAYGAEYNFYGGTGSIVGADQYGGAGGAGNYIAMGQYWTGNNDPYSLTLTSDVNYFGFWWSAGDTGNFVEFFKDGYLIATFTSANVFDILTTGAPTITSTGGDIYNKADYFGNPNSGENASEPYAFVSFYVTGGTFDEIRFDNGTGSTGFESDNHSLYYGFLTPDGSEVYVATIPEPGTVALFGLAAGGLLFFRRRQLTA